MLLLHPTSPITLLPVQALASMNINSCSCLGISSTALSKVVQHVFVLFYAF